jgi:hypothetical protein
VRNSAIIDVTQLTVAIVTAGRCRVDQPFLAMVNSQHGGQLEGVIGGIIGSASQTRVAVLSGAISIKTPIRVGGRVRPPQILPKTTPEYPALAKATKTQGLVEIDAIIDAKGNVSGNARGFRSAAADSCRS